MKHDASSSCPQTTRKERHSSEQGETQRRTGSMDISRRPQPCLSGRDGWAPTRTLFALASWTVSFMMEKSLIKSVHGERSCIHIEHVKSSRCVEAASDVREVDGLHEGFIIALPA